ncbi:hypothetical protein OOZ54_12780 [Rhodopseudomonas palustris]|uniref:hypothetical protein n=1 Tax=Rhodopseudomonas palustris TaxID=1076 RepID=UPI0022F0A84F|nr:hypothetical protein [Rhodopseudomonas palustris]WBU27569.1 hypothetical protein OOZ54_12780 [Rhodopseudomonas palustris]
MQPVNPESVRAAKASDRKALAIIAYDNACADPQSANWRAVADMLRLALPATRTAKTAAPTSEPSRFAPWSDYSVNSVSCKRLGKSPIVVVTFADGEIVRAPAVSLPGKPINIGRALRVASAFYEGRIAIRYGGHPTTRKSSTFPRSFRRCAKPPAPNLILQSVRHGPRTTAAARSTSRQRWRSSTPPRTIARTTCNASRISNAPTGPRGKRTAPQRSAPRRPMNTPTRTALTLPNGCGIGRHSSRRSKPPRAPATDHSPMQPCG